MSNELKGVLGVAFMFTVLCIYGMSVSMLGEMSRARQKTFQQCLISRHSPETCAKHVHQP